MITPGGRATAPAYGARREAMLAALAAHLPAGTRWTDPDGGMFTWVALPDGLDAAALLPVAPAHEVAFVPGGAFFVGAGDPARLRMSFSTHAPERIEVGVGRLGAAVAALARG